MGDYDAQLRRGIEAAVLRALDKGTTTTTELVDALFVQLKPLVHDERREYTIAQLREMLTGLL